MAKEETWTVLSDAELARRGQRITFIGVAVLLVVGAVSLWLVSSAKLEPAKAGPLHIVGAGRQDPNLVPIPVSGEDRAPKVAAPAARKPVPQKSAPWRPPASSGEQAN